ncbi:30S ribosomal protein S18 [bacterium HR17]|uniref:Small ribosomal subunit protein bS18 n=1 Tax=Candidatus Fervidibacter japonicus TaxID=2035412 RepID=A0A2H5XCF3_9BACT|nr:30S ribosomal protein S18 [bacterium HR17]
MKRPMTARRKKKKRCQWCMEGIRYIDYKSVSRLQRFMDSKGKILPRRQTGNCARHQRQLAVAIKRARTMGLLPFVVY